MDAVRNVFSKIMSALRGAGRWAAAHKVGAGVIVVAVLGGGYLAYAHYSAQSAGSEYVVGHVTRGELSVTVEGSGQVTANQQLDLSPKASGTVTSVRVKAGDQVSAGEVIATVDDTDAEKTLRDQYASLESAQISYQQAVANANNDTTNAVGDALSAAATAMTDLPPILQNLDTAMNTMSSIPGHTSQINANAYAAIVGGSQGDAMRDTAKQEYQNAKTAYQAALSLSTSISRTSSPDDIDAYLAKVYAAATAVSQAENDTHDLLQQVDNKLVNSETDIPASFSTILTQSATDESKSNGDVSSVYSAKASLESATATLSGSGGGQTLALESAQLSLTKAQNAYRDAQDALADYTVVAPFSGTIAKVNVQTHDNASSGTAVATLITNETYAELSLNEVDAAKVKAGQKVSLTFDAIDGLTIPGTVAEIDTVGTVSSGVVTYDVKISFDEQDERVKPGMTVNATITADSVQDALIVPSSAVTTVGSQSFVQVVTEGAPEASTTARANRFASSTQGFASTTNRFRNASTTASTTFGGAFARTAGSATETVPASSVTVTRLPVTVGLSSDTETQIVSGLTEGEAIVVRTTSGTSAVTTGTSAAGGSRAFGGGATRAVPAAGGNAVFRAGG